MKRERRSFIVWTAVALLFFCAHRGLAQTDAARNGGPEQPSGDSGSNMPSASHDAARPTSETALHSADSPGTRRLVARVRQLQAAMVKNLDLEEKQLATVKNLVGEFIRTLGVHEDPQEPSRLDRIELCKMRAKMMEAKKSGDSAGYESFRRKWIDRTVRLPRSSAPTATLIKSIVGVLHDTQIRGFRRILQRVHLHVGATLPPTNVLTTILRAANDPSLDLTNVQQTAIREIVREEILAIPKERRGPKGMGEAVPAIRKRIINVLTSSQGAKFQALLNSTDKNHHGNRKTRSTEHFEPVAPTEKSPSAKSASESKTPDENRE
ncbi:MAG: hypothetical protein IH987_20260 [Planctomycetes bacterium]|nr:hypothetical protein [Planctomycetota bacterium]